MGKLVQWDHKHKKFPCKGSMVGFVIQDTLMAKFEDAQRKGNQSEAEKSLQSVCNIPENKGIIVFKGSLDRVSLGQIKVQPNKFHSIFYF